MLQKHLSSIKSEYLIDATIVNGENSCNNGRGITSSIAKFLHKNGVDIITSGNHIWDNKEIFEYLKENNDLIRPANFPSECPGVGVTTFNCQGFEIGVINLQGRIFMRENIDCPFKCADSILTYLKHKTKVILVDFHAEATAEKMALGFYLDGKVSCVVGTHTHVATADERILPNGTAYVTDIGMIGSINSLIGLQKDAIIEKFKNQMPCKFTVETLPPVIMTGVWVEIDTSTGKAIKIERIKIVDENLMINE